MCKDYPPFGSRQILSQNNAVAIHLLVKVSGDEEQGELIAHLRLMRTDASCTVTLLLPHVFMEHLLPLIFTAKPVGSQSGVSGPMRPANAGQGSVIFLILSSCHYC